MIVGTREQDYVILTSSCGLDLYHFSKWAQSTLFMIYWAIIEGFKVKFILILR